MNEQRSCGTYTQWNITQLLKSAFESVLMRWLKLEPIIHSEVSQKEKHQYSILTHIYMEFRKMVMMNLCARQQKRHRYKEQTFGLWEKPRVGWFERIALKHVYYHMWNRWPVQVRCMKQDTQSQCTGTTQRDRMRREVGEGVWDGEVHMCIHGRFMSMYGKNHHDNIK